MKIGIIGSNGVLGQILTEQLSLRGHDLSLFGRRSDLWMYKFDVLTDEPHEQMQKVDCIIYLAWATKERTDEVQSKHAEAAGRWAEYCESIGVKFVFISTVLAHEKARSKYGEYKFKAEQLITNTSGKSLRVGSVADDAYPLLLTKIRHLGRKIPAIKAFANWPIYALSSTTFTNVVERISITNPSESIFWVAPKTPTSLASIVSFENSRERTTKRVNGIVALLAKIPLNYTKIDALKGFIDPLPVREVLKVVKDMEIAALDWQNQLDS